MPVHGHGPAPAKVLLVGEAPGADEVTEGRPFVGASGMFLNSMLQSIGILRSEVFVTNVARERPPQNKIGLFFLNHDPKGELPKPTKTRRKPLWEPGPVVVQGLNALRAEVERVQPNVIVPMGNVALWAVEGSQSISKWRGSILTSKPEFGSRKVIPTYHPAYILRSYGDYPCMQADLFRVRKQMDFPEVRLPERNYIIRPTLGQVQSAVSAVRAAGIVALDIETRGREISCISLAWSRKDAICIPFMDSKNVADGAYWREDEEYLVWVLLQDLFKDPSVEKIGQNFSYDATYLCLRRGLAPKHVRPKWDTLVMHHQAFPGLEKSLDFMASMYCDWYRYWKDDGKEWDTSLPEEQHWSYNCDDGVYTFELKEILEAKLKECNQLALYHHRMERLWPALFQMMLRGVRCNKGVQASLAGELMEFMVQTGDQIRYLLGHDFNPNSNPQCKALFYEDFGATPIVDRKTKQPTTNDDALDLIGRRMPWLRPLCERIVDYRSARTLLNNLGEVDGDGRMRCNFNICGAESFRLSSTKNNFGTGMNMQNIAKGEDDERWHPGRLRQPNIRLMFEADPGYTLADIDLQRADLVVVAREAADTVLQQQLAEGLNPYKIAACEYLKCSVEELEAKYAARYTLLKSFYHGTNYGGSAFTMARNCAMTQHEAELLQRRWFGEHPGIKAWHDRIMGQLRGRHEVRNAFGYRRRYFDRPDSLLPKALAWIPQCLPLDCEVLTPNGWQTIGCTDTVTPIAVWKEGQISFEVPCAWHRGKTHTLAEFQDLGYACTLNHRIPYYNAGREDLQVTTADRLPSGARVPRTGLYSGGPTHLPRALLRLLVAIQADAYVDHKRGSIQFEFCKPRKITALRELLQELCIPFSENIVRRGATVFYIHKGHGIPLWAKYFGPFLLELSAANLDWFLEELEFWDGWRSPRGELWYSSSHKENCEWVATIAALRGKRARWLSPDTRGTRTNWRVTIAPNKGKLTTPSARSIVSRETEVACPTVSSGFFLVRSRGEISVTGNSTVAIVTLEQIINIFERMPEVQLLLQVHDSLVCQYPTADEDRILRALRPLLDIPIPYPGEPLILKPGLATSTTTWGAVQKRPWPAPAEVVAAA